MLRGFQTKLAATFSPADIVSVCCIHFVQPQWAASRDVPCPTESARNSEQACPKLGGL